MLKKLREIARKASVSVAKDILSLRSDVLIENEDVIKRCEENIVSLFNDKDTISDESGPSILRKEV